jgi:hypothetical protein
VIPDAYELKVSDERKEELNPGRDEGYFHYACCGGEPRSEGCEVGDSHEPSDMYE